MSGLSLWFEEDVTNRLQALSQANDAALALAERYGMDPEAAGLCREVYSGALADVRVAFLGALQTPTVLVIPPTPRRAVEKWTGLQQGGGDPRCRL